MLTRQRIRNFIVATLIAEEISEVKEGTGAGATYRVYANRPTPLFMPELPAICVYTGSRPAGSESIKERGTYQDDEHDLPITVEILVPANDSVDDDLDTIAEKVELAIGRVRYAGPNGKITYKVGNVDTVVEGVGNFDPSGVEIGLAANGDVVIGSLKQNFNVTYFAGMGVDEDDTDIVEKIHSKITQPDDVTDILAEMEQVFPDLSTITLTNQEPAA